MNKLTKVLKSKALAAASFLVLTIPSLSYAAVHFISINPVNGIATVSPGKVDGAGGALTADLILSGLENNDTTFTGSLSTIRVENVSICSGTEWLDQGTAAVGVHGTLSGGNYTLTIPAVTVTASAVSGPCDTLGATNVPLFSHSVTIQKNNGQGQGNTYSTTYNFWNVTNGVPEPGTLALMLMALLGLAWFSRKRIPGSAT